MLLVGVAANRRTTLLGAAVATWGGRLAVRDWKTLAGGAGLDALECSARGHRWCKLDSPGEDAGLTDALVRRGWQLDGERTPAPQPLRTGELAYGRWWYLGFAELVSRVAARLAAVPGLRLINPADEILRMVDKFTCQLALRDARAGVPPLLGEIAGYDDFEARFPAPDAPRVFVKARYGSSAAGVIALERHRSGRLVATTSARFAADGRVYNHLRVTRHTDRAIVARLIDHIAAQGAYVERWVPKPRVPGSRDLHHDLRVVAFRGVPRQRVARLSASPLTNLHLRNARATPDWHGDAETAAVAAASARVAAAFPHSHTVGLDVIVRGGDAVVIEANAFGDLLPGLAHEGRTTYDDQAALVTADER